MVQLGHVVPAELLYRSYLFFTSTSRVMVEHFGDLMNDAADRFVPPGGLVVEIGSNDGTALSSIRRRDVRVLGIDPARNIAVMSASRGVPTVSEFFTEPLAHEIRRVAGPAHLIVACNVLGHIDQLDDTFAGIRTLLADNGTLVFEVPYLARSPRPLRIRHRLSRTPLLFRHPPDSHTPVPTRPATCTRAELPRPRRHHPHHRRPRPGASDDATAWIQREIDARLNQRATYDTFVATVQSHRDGLRKTLIDLRAQGRRVLGYGASAKAAVVLNYCGIGLDLLPAVIDSTPAKQGWCIPGTRQPILPPSAIESQRPDVFPARLESRPRNNVPRIRVPCTRRSLHNSARPDLPRNPTMTTVKTPTPPPTQPTGIDGALLVQPTVHRDTCAVSSSKSSAPVGSTNPTRLCSGMSRARLPASSAACISIASSPTTGTSSTAKSSSPSPPHPKSPTYKVAKCLELDAANPRLFSAPASSTATESSPTPRSSIWSITNTPAATNTASAGTTRHSTCPHSGTTTKTPSSPTAINKPRC